MFRTFVNEADHIPPIKVILIKVIALTSIPVLKSKTSGMIACRILPPAIIATLVVYCLRNVDFISGYHGAAEIIAVAVICVLHLWRRNTLLSVGGGTVVYMILVQVLA